MAMDHPRGMIYSSKPKMDYLELYEKLTGDRSITKDLDKLPFSERENYNLIKGLMKFIPANCRQYLVDLNLKPQELIDAHIAKVEQYIICNERSGYSFHYSVPGHKSPKGPTYIEKENIPKALLDRNTAIAIMASGGTCYYQASTTRSCICTS